MNKSLLNSFSVVIVHWNVPQSLGRCIQSIQACKYSELEIIVVDNNSTSRPKTVSGVNYIWNKDNLGFPKAVNQGIKKSQGKNILLLNPDTTVTPDFFSKSVTFLNSSPEIGIVGVKMVNPNGSPQGSVFYKPSVVNALLGKVGKYTPEGKFPCEVDAVSGGAMIVPRTTLDLVGNLSEEVFMYYEDLDYCRRVKRAGLKVIFHPELVVTHEHGESSKQNENSNRYLIESSKWYNGPINHYLINAILWTSQKLQRLAGVKLPNKT